ncbi:kinase-like protein [Lentithecium fluviatile CBS 122367]|uniref:non-specific serine/threonine protein kinase n=1 Tax=Lentithecium fluviatile CBS 122367 TaxID=1168545 RepID=A0A6G1JCJ2_9PLEO|nr:kinase-like protein [Lentithecium fluviatile CBS 122367]
MPSSPVAEARSLRSRIQDDLAHHIVNPDSIGDAYIRASDVVRAWSGHGTIERALYPAVLNGAEVEFIRNHLLTFLSILVYIDAHDFLRDFRANVFDVFDDNGSLRYADSKLPLVEKDVPALGKFHLRKRFLDDQYLFIPEVLVESATVKQISDQRRLPFESVSKDVFAGAYGKIDKVGISPSYFRTQDGATFSEIKYVASKRFHAQLPSSYTDPKRELDNLKVLKESITLHRNIRLHLAIILHKSEHLILLPWAEHLDLEIFLNEGRDFRGQEIYDFKRRFRSIQPGMMIKDICRQMHHVADALRWLHEGTITHGTRNRIRFAHMDLKPNNILIDNDNGTSAVGTWVLTDFGISAFKEDGDTADNLVSVRDYYENLTINTPPRRDAGAYQPPEVGQTNMKSSERRNGPREGSVGRRGDIWSFACIFAEVLAFSQGQAALLKEFRKVRKGRHRNDYFYEIDDDTLQPDGSKMSYRVRPQILDWLWALPDKYVFPKRAIDCCVETIQRVLVVDGSRRPKADELLKMFNHVENHVDLARAPGGFPPHCPLLHPTSIPSPLVVQHPIAKEPPLTPPIHIKRTNTIEEESLFTHQDWPSPPVGRSQSDSNPPPDANEPLQSPRHLPPGQLTPFRDREDSLLDPSNSSPPPPKSPTGLGIYNESARTSSITEVAQLSILSRQNSRESRRGLHGVMINQDKGRRMGAVTESIAHLTCSKKDIVSFNLCPSGRRVAYLTKAEESHYGIQLFDILSENSQVKKTVRFWPVSNPIALPTGTKWKHVVVADDNTVAWGKSGDGTGSKQVYITNPMGSRLFNGSEFKGLSTLTAVAISQRGSLAFVSNKSILYTVIERARRLEWFAFPGVHPVQKRPLLHPRSIQ